MTTKQKKESHHKTVSAAGYIAPNQTDLLAGTPLFDPTYQQPQQEPPATGSPKIIPVTLEQRIDRMSEFLRERLEQSKKYFIADAQRDYLLVEVPQQGPGLDPLMVFIAIHIDLMTKKEFCELQRQHKDIYTANIFPRNILYNKEGRPLFWRRLAEVGHYKAGLSLKKYTKAQIDSMIELNDIEKASLENTQILTYYQSATPRLHESIRAFHMREVDYDYSHPLKNEGRVRSFAGWGRRSERVKIPRQTQRILSHMPAYLLLNPKTKTATITSQQPQ